MSNLRQLYGRPWSEREYILVLDAYFFGSGKPRHVNSPSVKRLAELLGRTPASIYMRMENFASIDPSVSQHRKGLVNINTMCRKLFYEWSEKREYLKTCAEVLTRDIQSSRSPQLNLFEPEIAIPRAFGKYELLDLIGEGASGKVFSCMNVETHKLGALKIIQIDRLPDREQLHRFVREIRALKSMRHPHVVRLHEDNLDEERDFPAFVMDLATSNLTDYVNAKLDTEEAPPSPPILPFQESAEIMRAMISAVKALHNHERKIIHRDINPNNILHMDDGRWALGDLGLAKFLGSATQSTFSTLPEARGLGTIYYAPPEQYLTMRTTDNRADIYALGVLLWQLFSSASPPPSPQAAGLPEALGRVFAKAFEREPGNRYQTMEHFEEAFEFAYKHSKIGL